MEILERELNVELLDRVIAHISSIPSSAEAGKGKGDVWNQRSWGYVEECQTSGCIAGWTCILKGRDKGIKDSDSVSNIQNTAQQLLGLTNSHADALFDSDNIMSDLLRIAEVIKAGKKLRRAWVEV